MSSSDDPHSIIILDTRLAFPQLWQPQQVNGQGKPAFSGSFLIAPDHAQRDAIDDLIDTVAGEKWGAKAKALVAKLRAADKVCLHDGDLKDKYEGFAGNLYISARAYSRPTVIDRLRAPVAEEDGLIYAGCYVNVKVQIWAQDNSWGQRVNASLKGVQFFREGDAFSGGAPADPMDFDDLGPGESALA